MLHCVGIPFRLTVVGLAQVTFVCLILSHEPPTEKASKNKLVDSLASWLMVVSVVHVPFWPTFDVSKYTYIFSLGWVLAIRRAVGEGLHIHGLRTSGDRMNNMPARNRLVTRNGGGSRIKDMSQWQGRQVRAQMAEGAKNPERKRGCRAADWTTEKGVPTGAKISGSSKKILGRKNSSLRKTCKCQTEANDKVWRRKRHWTRWRFSTSASRRSMATSPTWTRSSTRSLKRCRRRWKRPTRHKELWRYLRKQYITAAKITTVWRQRLTRRRVR